MIRMQKQKEEAKKEAERQAAMDVAEQEESNGKCDDQSEAKTQEGGLSVLGIGGKQIRSAGAKKVGKKRTPGEIRIQKGNCSKCPFCSQQYVIDIYV